MDLSSPASVLLLGLGSSPWQQPEADHFGVY